jgi:hypothetical protein
VKRTDGVLLALLLLLGATAVLVAARLASHARGARTELGRVVLTELPPDVAERIARLDDDLRLTYYVSPRAIMPPAMKRIEEQMRDLLSAFERAGAGRVTCQVLAPESEPELASWAASQRIAPSRLRTVTRDAWSERTIWSSLRIAYGPHPATTLGGIRPEHLPRIAPAVLAVLEQAERPAPPRVALALPRGEPDAWSTLTGILEATTELTLVDLDGGEPLPEDTDLAIWIEPSPEDERPVRALEQHVARGRTALVAGSPFRVEPSLPAPDGAGEGVLSVPGRGLGAVLAPLGLGQADKLLLDEQCVFVGEAARPLPHRLRAIAPQHDFRGLAAQPNGTLRFDAAAPITLSHEVLLESGWTPQVLVTSSDASRLLTAPAERTDARALESADAEPSARQPLAVLLHPADSWGGALVALASSTLLRDGSLSAGGTAHERLLGILLAELAGPGRLVAHAAEAPAPDPLPFLSASARIAARALCLGLWPAVLLAAWLVRTRARGGARAAGGGRSRPALSALAAPLAASALLILALGLLPHARADLTAERVNVLAPVTRELAARAAGEKRVRARLVFSGPEQLPPALRPRLRRLEGLLDDLASAGAELGRERVRPGELDEEARAALAADGITPARSATDVEGVLSVRRFWATLELTARGRTERLSLWSARDWDDLEFRVAFALWRLETGERPHLALASDVPRHAPAVEYEEYLSRAEFAPRFADPYGAARSSLERAGWRVTHVNPADPVLPTDSDAVVWLQPRRSIEALLDLVADHLHRGGRLLLAAQHFVIRPQQFRGRDFEVVHWPEPQTADVDQLYFPDLGVELARDVLLDERMGTLRLETQVARSDGRREWERQEQALPFLVRAVGANFDTESPISRGLSDQLFPFAAHVRLDAGRLERAGLSARTLVTSSARSWTHPWKGGFLPPQVLAGPPDAEDDLDGWAGPQALVVHVEGSFPPWRNPPSADAAPGELLLVGSSEMFKDERLLDPDFRAVDLLTCGVAALTLPPELADLAARRPHARGFEWVPPADRLRWRALVIGAGPLLLAVLALARRALSRRPTRTGGIV